MRNNRRVTVVEWTDRETGELVRYDVSGWQIVFTSSAGEIMRVDFSGFVLLTALGAGPLGPDEPFRVSHFGFGEVRDAWPPGGALIAPDGYWYDLRVEKR